MFTNIASVAVHKRKAGDVCEHKRIHTNTVTQAQSTQGLRFEPKQRNFCTGHEFLFSLKPLSLLCFVTQIVLHNFIYIPCRNDSHLCLNLILKFVKDIDVSTKVVSSPQDILANFQKVFLTDKGIIDDENKLDQFVKAIHETDKRSDLKCFYSQILKKSSTNIREKFISNEFGGWKIICKWYAEAIDIEDDDLLIDVLDLIEKVPFQSSHLITSTGKQRPIRRFMKKSAKHKNPEIARIAKSIYRHMQKLSNSNKKASSSNDVAIQVRPILMQKFEDRRSRKRKSLSWRPDEKISEVRYFEYIEDERCNVSRQSQADMAAAIAANAIAAGHPAAAGSSGYPNSSYKNPSGLSSASGSGSSCDVNKKGIDDPRNAFLKWPPLVPIDMPCEIPTPGWNSKERSAEAERESRVLGAIDLPGQQATLDEPDQPMRVEVCEAKIIPLEAVDGGTKIQDYSHLCWDQLQPMQTPQFQLQTSQFQLQTPQFQLQTPQLQSQPQQMQILQQAAETNQQQQLPMQFNNFQSLYISNLSNPMFSSVYQ